MTEEERTLILRKANNMLNGVGFDIVIMFPETIWEYTAIRFIDEAGQVVNFPVELIPDL